MKTKTMIVALAALSLMLTACGEKKAKDVLAAEDKTETANENQNEDENYTPESEVDVISSVWEMSPLAGVAKDGKVGIEQFAQKFCYEYNNYQPNKELCDYFRDPAKYNNEDFDINCQSKNGYISCRGMFQCSFDTECCYWKRKNGHSLVAFWLYEGHESGAEYQLLAFYDYDPDTDTMTPEPALSKRLLDVVDKYDSYSVILPEEGTDIEIIGYTDNEEEDNCIATDYQAHWDGNDFTKIEEVNTTPVP